MIRLQKPPFGATFYGKTQKKAHFLPKIDKND